MPDRILIVDDDLQTLKLIGLMLEEKGYEISVASSGAQALELVEQDLPDLIILDVMMPEMDGYEVARQLRANPETAPIPILMFTAKGGVDDKVTGFEAGADDFLTKPAHPAELASRVKVLLSRSAKPAAAKPGKSGRVISFIGVKGGVGTTTLALNTAVAMSQVLDGSAVLLAETRPGQGSLGLMFQLSQTQGLNNLLSRGQDLSRQNVEAELVRHETGLYLLLASPFPNPFGVDAPPEVFETLARTLTRTAEYALLDLGNGLSSANKRLLATSDHIVVCLEPQHVPVALAQQMLQELHGLGLGAMRTSVVMNNRTPSSLQISWQVVQQTLQKEVVMISPAPELAYQANEERLSMVQFQPDSMIAGQFRKLGEDLLALVGSMPEHVE
jgi:pilus assembly protein CpaE